MHGRTDRQVAHSKDGSGDMDAMQDEDRSPAAPVGVATGGCALLSLLWAGAATGLALGARDELTGLAQHAVFGALLGAFATVAALCGVQLLLGAIGIARGRPFGTRMAHRTVTATAALLGILLVTFGWRLDFSVGPGPFILIAGVLLVIVLLTGLGRAITVCRRRLDAEPAS